MSGGESGLVPGIFYDDAPTVGRERQLALIARDRKKSQPMYEFSHAGIIAAAEQG